MEFIFINGQTFIARTLMPPEDLPIGIVTGFVGNGKKFCLDFKKQN